jgi:hypothetical protein
MVGFSNLFGKDSVIYERFERLRLAIRDQAINQSKERDLDVRVEAKKIGVRCGILEQGYLQKKHDPHYFVDIAMELLCYPPELGFIIAMEFTSFAHNLGWNPFGTVMVALSHINEFALHNVFHVRVSYLKERPDLFELANDRMLRAQRAGQLLAVAIIMSTTSIKDAKHIYSVNKYEALVKKSLDEELANRDREIGQKITC